MAISLCVIDGNTHVCLRQYYCVVDGNIIVLLMAMLLCAADGNILYYT